jgi:predicted nucleotidyltransferase/DNA-binding XRE family transcriptional regulator
VRVSSNANVCVIAHIVRDILGIMTQPSDIGRALVRRRRAIGMSQRELAERLGVAQPQIARWESGAYRTARLERLDAVARAVGLDVTDPLIAAEDTATYSASARTRPVRDLGEIAARLRSRSDELRSLGFTEIRVFGSFSTGTQGASSDVDLLVEVGPAASGLAFVRAADRVETILGRPVDVTRERLLKQRLRDRVRGEAVRVWPA